MGKSGPQPGIEIELRARGIRAVGTQHQGGFWVAGIGAQRDPCRYGTRAPDGNWRDLVERVRGIGKFIPVVLLSSTRTAELWWDALECGVGDILQAPLSAFTYRVRS